MNPEAFTPKTENLLHFWVIWKRRSLFPQPRDVSHARIFAEGIFEGRAWPSAAFLGKAGSRFYGGDKEPMFIPQDHYTPDCAEPLGLSI